MNEQTDKAQKRETGNEPRFPTSHDLLYLAVQLAGDNKFKRDEADEYVQRAFWLWMAADKFASSEYIEGILTPKRNQYSKGKKGDQKYSQDLQEYHRTNEDFFRQVNLPKKYPINLDKMLFCGISNPDEMIDAGLKLTAKQKRDIQAAKEESEEWASYGD